MSMKVYNAFRVKRPQDLWSLLWKIQAQAESSIREALRQHYWEIVSRMDPETPEYMEAKLKGEYPSEVAFRLSQARTLIREGYKKNSAQPYRDTYSLDVAVAVYPYRGQVYLRTFTESASVVGKVLDFVPKMRGLEDYHYQNQTDHPEEVPAKDWDRRKRVWNGITKHQGGVGRYVVLEILNTSNLYQLDPGYDLGTEWRANPPKLPLREEIWADDLRKLVSLKGVEIQARKGRILAKGHFLITLEHGEWFTILKGHRKKHPSLNHAAGYVHLEYQSESIKSMILHLKESHENAKK